jgi:hypothetical protein
VLKPSVFAAGSLLIIAGCGASRVPDAPVETSRQVVTLDASTLTRVHLTMGAGTLEVKGGASDLLVADFSYNVPSWKPTVTSRATGTDRDVEVTQTSESGRGSQTRNEWQVALHDLTPMDVLVRLGAGQAHLKLGTLLLRHADLDMGAGELELDLRGRPANSYAVKVRGGVGSATVLLPASVAISAVASGGLGSINVTGLEKRDGRWINPKVETSAVTIDLDVQGGVGEIKIVAE